MDDLALIKQCKAGKRAAFDAIIKKYYLPLIKFFYNHTGDSRVCEDLTHDVMLKFIENIHKYNPIKGVKFSSWLFRIAYNTYIDHVRKTPGQREIPLDEETGIDSGHDIADEVITSMEYEELHGKLCLLPHTMRTLLILRYINKLNYNEIQKITGIDKTKIKSKLHYSLRKIKDLYGVKE